MATIKLYENVDELIALYRNASSDSVDSISRLVSHHILTCLDNEASGQHMGTIDPIFNISYIDKLVTVTGFSVFDMHCAASLLRMRKRNKDAISDWDLLFKLTAKEISRRKDISDYADLLTGL